MYYTCVLYMHTCNVSFEVGSELRLCMRFYEDREDVHNTYETITRVESGKYTTLTRANAIYDLKFSIDFLVCTMKLRLCDCCDMTSIVNLIL